MPAYQNLILDIGTLLEEGRKQAYHTVNSILVRTYWEIGKKIVEFETSSKENAGYGTRLFERIAKDLKFKYGKGFSRSNVIHMRLFYLKYPKSQTLSDQLSWSHYFVSKYKLHLPSKKELEDKVNKIIKPEVLTW